MGHILGDLAFVHIHHVSAETADLFGVWTIVGESIGD